MREFRLIENAIKKFKVNLNGLCVLTEAASGNYIWTPIIAAMAGARVYAFSKNSKYGNYEKIKNNTLNYAEKIGVSKNINVIDKLTHAVISEADIITNTGFLRPLNKSILKYCKKEAAISLMWETWEFREKDIDISYCYQKGIPVLGTNESNANPGTFNYIGLIIKKMLLNNNIEIYKSQIIVLGKGIFAERINKSLRNDGAECFRYSSTNDTNILSRIKNSDAIVVADHSSDNIYFKRTDLVNFKTIKKLNPNILIIHITGGMDKKEILKYTPNIFPQIQADIHNMSITTAILGPKPIIDLHTAGLKVGMLLTKERRKNRNRTEAIKNVLKKCNIAQDFSLSQKLKYFK